MKIYTRTKHRGFTLLELLIAMTVFATMSIMAYGGLSNVITNSEASEQSLQRLRDVQIAMFNIERDLSQITERNIRDEFGTPKNYLEAGNNIDNLIELTRNGRRNPAKLLRSHLVRIAYKLDEGTLIRTTWPHLDRVQGMTPYDTPLLTAISAVEFRFLDNADEWHSEWPPTSAAIGAAVAPIAIECKITLDDWGTISRLFKIQS